MALNLITVSIYFCLSLAIPIFFYLACVSASFLWAKMETKSSSSITTGTMALFAPRIRELDCVSDCICTVPLLQITLWQVVECLSKSIYTHLWVFYSLYSTCTLILSFVLTTETISALEEISRIQPTAFCIPGNRFYVSNYRCFGRTAGWLLFSHFNFVWKSVSAPLWRAGFSGEDEEGRRTMEGKGKAKGV